MFTPDVASPCVSLPFDTVDVVRDQQVTSLRRELQTLQSESAAHLAAAEAARAAAEAQCEDMAARARAAEEHVSYSLHSMYDPYDIILMRGIYLEA